MTVHNVRQRVQIACIVRGHSRTMGMQPRYMITAFISPLLGRRVPAIRIYIVDQPRQIVYSRYRPAQTTCLVCSVGFMYPTRGTLSEKAKDASYGPPCSNIHDMYTYRTGAFLFP